MSARLQKHATRTQKGFVFTKVGILFW